MSQRKLESGEGKTTCVERLHANQLASDINVCSRLMLL